MTFLPRVISGDMTGDHTRYETLSLIPGETLIGGERREAFHTGIGYASYLDHTRVWGEHVPRD